MDYGLIIHGGAWDIPDEKVEDHLAGMEDALSIGHQALAREASALDVVEKVIACLEDDPTFDAGRGSFLNATGEIEMDAIIASDDYQIGAVAALQNIRHPVKVARTLLEEKGPVVLAGKGANLFASQRGFKECEPQELLVGRELERYHKFKNDPKFSPRDAFQRTSHGTVGAVALDSQGKVAVAVSTGGTPKKPPGRIGDTPLFGSGAYIEPDSLGVAATGYGEDLIKALISKRTFEYCGASDSIQQGIEKAIDYLSQAVDGLGGVIVLGEEGFGLDWNTPRMAFGLQINDGEAIVGIEKEDKKKVLKEQERKKSW